MDARSAVLAVVAVLFLFAVFMSGRDFGKRDLVTDIDSYGCEKVITKFHGVTK